VKGDNADGDDDVALHVAVRSVLVHAVGVHCELWRGDALNLSPRAV